MKFAVRFLSVFLLCLEVTGVETKMADTSGNTSLHYTFTYNFQMDMQGKIFLFIGYRFYYEASASVNFIGKVNEKDQYEFFFNGINRTGYVMTTGGLRGNSLYFFTADYDIKKGSEFREKKIQLFKDSNPYYAGNIKKIRRRPMVILSKNPGAIRFIRDKKGVHHYPEVNIRLTDSHSNTYSNIYKILGKLLMAYNHPFFPDDIDSCEVLKLSPDRTWVSSLLDYAEVLEGAARLTSERAEKSARFKQQNKFRLQYRIVSRDKSFLEIRGESFPDVQIMKDMKIMHVFRQVRLRLIDSVVVMDRLLIDFRNSEGIGGIARLKLNLQ